MIKKKSLRQWLKPVRVSSIPRQDNSDRNIEIIETIILNVFLYTSKWRIIFIVSNTVIFGTMTKIIS